MVSFPIKDFENDDDDHADIGGDDNEGKKWRKKYPTAVASTGACDVQSQHHDHTGGNRVMIRAWW